MLKNQKKVLRHVLKSRMKIAIIILELLWIAGSQCHNKMPLHYIPNATRPPEENFTQRRIQLNLCEAKKK